MNMKFIAVVMTGLALTSVVESAEAANINQRQDRQKVRTVVGVLTGKVGVGEAAKLFKQQATINRVERQLRQNGLSNGDRKALNVLLNAESKKIKQFKNN
jgi:hypothetical protein